MALGRFGTVTSNTCHRPSTRHPATDAPATPKAFIRFVKLRTRFWAIWSHLQMPSVYKISFSPSDETREYFGSRGDYYKLGDGSHVDVRSEPVWCHQCGGFADGESIEGLDEIDRHLTELRDSTSDLSRGLRYRQKIIEQFEERRRWLMDRESPPKCLECGSTSIVSFPIGERVRNPSGPGWVVVTIGGHCSTSFNNRYYTPEGDLIPRDTSPTYWTLPD